MYSFDGMLGVSHFQAQFCVYGVIVKRLLEKRDVGGVDSTLDISDGRYLRSAPFRRSASLFLPIQGECLPDMCRIPENTVATLVAPETWRDKG